MAKSKQDRLSRSRIHRVERSQQQNRYLIIGTISILIAVVSLVVYGFIFEKYFMLDQPVAIVNGEEISTRDFQARVRFERLPLVNYWNDTARNRANFMSNPELIGQFDQELDNIYNQLEPTNFGQNILARMINEVLVRQEADRRGIIVTEDEIDEAIMEIFGFFPNGAPTPTLSPTPIPISTLSLEQIALVSPTPTLTDTPTPTVTATTEVLQTVTATLENSSPESEEDLDTTPVTEELSAEIETATPTDAPSPTPTIYSTETYGENIRQAYEYQELTVQFNEADFRKTIESQLYNEKLINDLTKDIPEEEDQIWLRHIQTVDEEAALEILGKLDDGEDWTALASEFSTDPSTNTTGGDLGWLGELINKTDQSEFIDILYEEAMAANAEFGLVLGPIESDSGWHIIQILGSGIIIFSGEETSQIRSAVFTEWLTQAHLDYEIVVKGYVSRRTPDEPSPDYSLYTSASDIPIQ